MTTDDDTAAAAAGAAGGSGATPPTFVGHAPFVLSAFAMRRNSSTDASSVATESRAPPASSAHPGGAPGNGPAAPGAAPVPVPMFRASGRYSLTTRNSTDGYADANESSTSIRQAMRHAWHRLPGIRKSSGSSIQSHVDAEEYDPAAAGSDDAGVKSVASSSRRRREASVSDHGGPMDTSSMLQRNSSGASNRSMASSGGSSMHDPPSRTGSIKCSMRPPPMSEIPEPTPEEGVASQAVAAPVAVTPAPAGASSPSPPPPPPPPPVPPPAPISEKRAMFLRARTKSIDHMHKFLNLKNFGKDRKKGKKNAQAAQGGVPVQGRPPGAPSRTSPAAPSPAPGHGPTPASPCPSPGVPASPSRTSSSPGRAPVPPVAISSPGAPSSPAPVVISSPASQRASPGSASPQPAVPSSPPDATTGTALSPSPDVSPMLAPIASVPIPTSSQLSHSPAAQTSTLLSVQPVPIAIETPPTPLPANAPSSASTEGGAVFPMSRSHSQSYSHTPPSVPSPLASVLPKRPSQFDVLGHASGPPSTRSRAASDASGTVMDESVEQQQTLAAPAPAPEPNMRGPGTPQSTVDDSLTNPPSTRSMGMFDSTSLETADDSVDRSFGTPEKSRRRSHSVPGTAMSLIPSMISPLEPPLSSNRSGEAQPAQPAQPASNVEASDEDDRARVGALALATDDEEEDETPAAQPAQDTSISSSINDLFLETDWQPDWEEGEKPPPRPLHEHGAQELIDNLGLDALDVPGRSVSPRSSYPELPVERDQREKVASNAPSPALSSEAFGVAHGGPEPTEVMKDAPKLPRVWTAEDDESEAPQASPAATLATLAPPSVLYGPPSGSALGQSASSLPTSEAGTSEEPKYRPLNRILEPLNMKALSLSEHDVDSSSATTPWSLRFKRAPDTEPVAPVPPLHAPRGSMDESTNVLPRHSEEEQRVPRALRGSKSSSLLTAVASQAHRIKKNTREAWPPAAQDEDMTFVADEDDKRPRTARSDTGSDAPSTDTISITSPTKPDTPLSMYRTKRNKSQPTLRIADDREFLEALEQVRMQHKERMAHRERARSSRKASMPNLRSSSIPSGPGLRRPPMPLARVTGDDQHDRSERSGCSRTSSAASRSDKARQGASPDAGILPDMSTSFLEVDSADSSSGSSSDGPKGIPNDVESHDGSGQGGGGASRDANDERSEGAHSAESDMLDPIPNELGIGHTTGNVPSAPFTNDDDWKKEVKALFLIRELVQTERSYAAHLESLLIVVLKWTGKSSTRLQTNVLMPLQQPTSSQRVPPPTTVPPHLVTLRNMLPKLISVSRVLVYSIEESPTSEGVARAFLSVRPRLEEVHVSWHGVVGATLRAMRATEASKSKSKGRLGRVPVAPHTAEMMRRSARGGSSDPACVDAALESDRRGDKSRASECAPKELSAVDVAIMPTQRIPRYALLLRDLLSYTSPETEAYETLNQALACVQELGYLCDQASTNTQ